VINLTNDRQDHIPRSEAIRSIAAQGLDADRSNVLWRASGRVAGRMIAEYKIIERIMSELTGVIPAASKLFDYNSAHLFEPLFVEPSIANHIA